MDLSQLGKYTITLMVFLTAILYFFSKPVGFDIFFNFWLNLSQLMALIGATLLSVNYVLSTRAKILEPFFGGLDKLYQSHHLVGTAAFVVMISHPLFLVLNVLPNIALSQKYLFISSNLIYSFGVISLYSFILILLFTFIIKLPYHVWFATHRLLGFPLIFAIIHILFISSDVSRYLPLRLWIIFLLGIALWSYLYKLFFYVSFSPKFIYHVSRIKNLGGLLEIYLKPQSASIKFNPGQFTFVKFSQSGLSDEFHPFSLSSSPTDSHLRLSVKLLGDYTNQLTTLKTGTLATIIGPYGQFYKKFNHPKPMICLAGGIGVTPFLSLLAMETLHPQNRPINFYYCTKTTSEAVYHQELSQYHHLLPQFYYQYFCSSKNGHITAAKIKSEVPDFANSQIFLCGPKSFMTSLQLQFSQLGLKSSQIIFEDFSFHETN